MKPFAERRWFHNASEWDRAALRPQNPLSKVWYRGGNRIKLMAIRCGAAPDKVHICHMDNRLAGGVPVKEYLTKPEVGRNIFLETHKALLDLGVTIGLDTWGMPITGGE